MSGRPTAALFCPGRGSYGRGELGSIAAALRPGEVGDALAEADRERRDRGLETIGELDAREQFRPGVHLDAVNASELIYFASAADIVRLREEFDIVAVAGNSLGFYTAMWASGCLDATQARRLVAGMARIQAGTRGAQILTTTLDDDWREDPALARAIEDALAATRARGPDWFVAHSIRLGGHEVLAGTESGVRALLEELPQVRLGERAFPLQLAGHGPFHTELCREVAQVALEELSDLPIRPPRVHLIDGRGDVHSPWSADPRGLLRYTLETQVVTTFDFTAAVRTALREFCPDVLLCAGPGTSLRAPVGHVVLREGYRGIHDKERLFATALVR